MRGKDPRDAHFITRRICGICGDNHATCAVYTQNMAFDVRPPPLDNAVKYSPHGGVIEVRLRRTDEEAELSVRDHGLGIPPDKREAIFERFYQAHSSGHRSGLGLGLYICRQIVEMHRGSIHAEFPADGGSRFVVRLPLAEARSSATAA